MLGDLLRTLAVDHISEKLGDRDAWLHYLQDNDIDPAATLKVAGPFFIRPIVDCGGGRFDISDRGDAVPGFICLDYGRDGQALTDLVGWPLSNPDKVMSVLGRCGFLGLEEALDPLNNLFDTPLNVHRTPLAWLQSGCIGTAIVNPWLAARQMPDLPGKIAAQDHDHGIELVKMARSIFDVSRIVVPTSNRRVAA